MRQIKFRFVFKNEESGEIRTKIFAVDDLIDRGIDDIMEFYCDCQPVGETNVVECNCEEYLQKFVLIAKDQFTGLLDKNGVEAYEGDICDGNWPYSKRLVIVWDDKRCGFFMGTSLNISNEPKWKVAAASYDKYYKMNSAKFEIIGNVHKNGDLLNENPELLGDKQ